MRREQSQTNVLRRRIQMQEFVFEPGLIKGRSKKKEAKPAQSFFRQLAPNVIVAPLRSVGSGQQGFALPFGRANQSPAQDSKPTTVQAATPEIHVGKEPRHPPIAFKKRRDPKQTRTTGRGMIQSGEKRQKIIRFTLDEEWPRSTESTPSTFATCFSFSAPFKRVGEAVTSSSPTSCFFKSFRSTYHANDHRLCNFDS